MKYEITPPLYGWGMNTKKPDFFAHSGVGMYRQDSYFIVHPLHFKLLWSRMNDEVVEAMGRQRLNEFVEKTIEICVQQSLHTVRPYFKPLDLSLEWFHPSSRATPRCANILQPST